MTIIAYDGLYVAADRMISNDSGMHGLTRKLHIFEGRVLATTGAADHGEAMVIWFKDGMDPKAFPHAHDGDKASYLYAFGLHQPVMCFQTWPSPVLFPMESFAAGTGADIARTAMYLGCDARRAAKAACDLNVYCGNGVEYVDLAELANTDSATVRRYANP